MRKSEPKPSQLPGSRGFSLLEVIVVLVITSLITTILMQGLSVVLGTKLRFSTVLSGIEERSLQQSVISSPLQGLVPDYDDGSNKFAGENKRLKGLTLSPLHGLVGAPTIFALAIDYNTAESVSELTYFENGYGPIALAKWPTLIGEFSYRGRDGEWRKTWPPPGDQYLQVPRTIRIETGLEQADLFVQVMGPQRRPYRIQDSLLGPSQ